MLQAVYETSSRYNILNGDETQWLFCYMPPRTVTLKGIESVKVQSPGDPHQGFTMMASISAAGSKLPLFLIAKGLSERCHKQFGNHEDNYYVAHSKSGWMWQAVYLEYLQFLRSTRPNDIIDLVADQYPTHFSDVSQEKAKELDIVMVPVPKGGTAKYQPLDKKLLAH
jgi:hypothetical protein